MVVDAEEDVEGPEAHGLDDEQVGGPDATESRFAKKVRQRCWAPGPSRRQRYRRMVAHHDAEP